MTDLKYIGGRVYLIKIKFYLSFNLFEVFVS